MQAMKETISGNEDMIEERDSSVKENIKVNKVISQNIHEIWDTMKRPKLRILGIKEGERYKLEGIENIFNKSIEEYFPKLKKNGYEDTRSLQNNK